MDFSSLNTTHILDTISRHCPRALSTYIHCLCRADTDGKLFLSKQEINKTLSDSYTKFRNNIKQLAVENLLEWHEINNGLVVTLILPEDL